MAFATVGKPVAFFRAELQSFQLSSTGWRVKRPVSFPVTRAGLVAEPTCPTVIA